MSRKKLRCLIYARQSVGKDDESASVDEQLLQCRKLADSKELVVVDEFKDLDTSGVTYPSGSEQFARSDTEWLNYIKSNAHVLRKSFRKGLGDALKRLSGIDYLLCYDESRLMRPLANSYLGNHISQALINAGVKLYTVHDGEIDYQRFDQKMVSTLRQQVEADIKAKLRQRCKDGLRQAKDEGRHCGCPPYGYRKTKDGFEIVDKQADAIRHVYTSYLAGASITSLGQTMPVKAPRGHWVTNSITRLLQQPAYIGMAVNTQGELIESKAYPAILEKELWLEVQAKLRKAVRHHVRKSPHRHYLRGIGICGNCGSRMQVSYNPSKNSDLLCPSPRYVIKKERDPDCVKARVGEHIQWKQDSKKFQAHGLADCLAPLTLLGIRKHSIEKARIATNPERLLALENETAMLERKLAENNRLWRVSLMDTTDYQENRKDFKARLQAVQDEMNSLKEASISEKERQRMDWSKLRHGIRLGEPPEEELSELLHDVISKVLIYPFHIEVTLFDGTHFSLERIPHLSSRTLPAWTHRIDLVHDETGEPHHVDIICYLYKSSYRKGGDLKTLEIIYRSPSFEIWTVGRNPTPRKWVLGEGYVPVKPHS